MEEKNPFTFPKNPRCSFSDSGFWAAGFGCGAGAGVGGGAAFGFTGEPGGVLDAVVVVRVRSEARKTKGASIWTCKSSFFARTGAAASGTTAARCACEPAGPAIAGRDALGSGGSMGSIEARAEPEFDDGNCKFGGSFASAT